jgi:isopenicillin N synthase-like dioxygenase
MCSSGSLCWVGSHHNHESVLSSSWFTSLSGLRQYLSVTRWLLSDLPFSSSLLHAASALYHSLSPMPTLPPSPSSSSSTPSMDGSFSTAEEKTEPALHVFFHFRYQQQPIVLRVPVHPGPVPRYPLQGLPLVRVTAELLEAMGLSSAMNRVVGVMLPNDGPIVPLICLRKLPPNKPDSPYEVLVESFTSATHQFPLLAAPSPPTPGSVVDVDYADLLHWSSTDSPDSSLPCRLVSALQRVGYFRIRLPGDSAFVQLLTAATDTALQVFALPAKEKRTYRRDYEYSKFCGYSLDGARQFVQVRTCKELLPWPPGAEAPFSATFLFLAAVARMTMQTLSAAEELQLDFASQVEPMLEPLPGNVDPASFLRQMEAGLAATGSTALAEPFQSVVWPEERVQRFHAHKELAQADDAPDRSEEKRESPPSPVIDPVMAAAFSQLPLNCSLAAFLDRYSLGPDVLRIYQYFREPDEEPPKLGRAATGLHVDMGLLTVSPHSRVPGLTLLHPDGTRWVAVEGDVGDSSLYLNVLSGETMSFLTHGVVRAAAHFVDEIPGAPRISMPFFLRANPHAICHGRTIRSFLEEVAFPRRAVMALKVVAPQSQLGKAVAVASTPVAERKDVCKWSDY